jgi:hypothetical protein
VDLAYLALLALRFCLPRELLARRHSTKIVALAAMTFLNVGIVAFVLSVPPKGMIAFPPIARCPSAYIGFVASGIAFLAALFLVGTRQEKFEGLSRATAMT